MLSPVLLGFFLPTVHRGAPRACVPYTGTTLPVATSSFASKQGRTDPARSEQWGLAARSTPSSDRRLVDDVKNAGIVGSRSFRHRGGPDADLPMTPGSGPARGGQGRGDRPRRRGSIGLAKLGAATRPGQAGPLRGSLVGLGATKIVATSGAPSRSRPSPPTTRPRLRAVPRGLPGRRADDHPGFAGSGQRPLDDPERRGRLRAPDRDPAGAAVCIHFVGGPRPSTTSITSGGPQLATMKPGEQRWPIPCRSPGARGRSQPATGRSESTGLRGRIYDTVELAWRVARHGGPLLQPLANKTARQHHDGADPLAPQPADPHGAHVRQVNNADVPYRLGPDLRAARPSSSWPASVTRRPRDLQSGYGIERRRRLPRDAVPPPRPGSPRPRTTRPTSTGRRSTAAPRGPRPPPARRSAPVP